MPPDLSSHPLIAWAQRPEINQLSHFVAACEQLTDDVLVAAYQAERIAAPQRALAGKRYLTTARQGFPHTTDVSNRGEEHLALAIFNAYGGKPITTPDGELLRVIDYQVPLKAHRDDAGVGKIDLLALTATGQVTVIELKAGSGRDTPLRALLEGLAYVAILEANLATVQTELEERGELAAHEARVTIHVDMRGESLSLHEVSDGRNRRGHREIRPCLLIDPQRCSDVDGVQDFHNVLLLAVGLGDGERRVFEVKLPAEHRGWLSEWLAVAFEGHRDAGVLPENTPDGRGARKWLAERTDGGVLAEVVHDGFGTRNALQWRRWRVTERENAVDDQRVKRRLGRVAGVGAIQQDACIVRRRSSQALAPALNPPRGATNGVGILRNGPIRLCLLQAAELAAIHNGLHIHVLPSLQARHGWS